MARKRKDPAEAGKRLNPAKQAAFLAAYSECGNIKLAGEISKTDRFNHYDWMKIDPTYPERFATAKEMAVETLEAEARRRAVEGVEEPVYGSMGQGAGTGQVGTVTKYSDVLLIFLLKGAAPEKYRDRLDHRHSGAGGGPIQTSVSIQQVMDLLDSREYEQPRIATEAK
jgi:hypothetical protein